MKFFVDLNSDIGEGYGAYKLGMDEEIMKCVTSVNCACGWHAGDPLIMDKTIKIAKEKIDFKEIMLSKMQNFSLKETEDIILRISKKELKHIEIIGGILGGIIAVFQFFVMLFVKQI